MNPVQVGQNQYSRAVSGIKLGCIKAWQLEQAAASLPDVL